MSYDSTVEEFNLYEIFEDFNVNTTAEDKDDQVITFDPAAELLSI